jgi:hypothetical protein
LKVRDWLFRPFLETNLLCQKLPQWPNRLLDSAPETEAEFVENKFRIPAYNVKEQGS